MSSPTLGLQRPPSTKCPVPYPVELACKCPVTQEVMAMHVGAQVGAHLNGREPPPSTKTQELYLGLLQDSVANLVFKRAAAYGSSCPCNEVEDMAQNCWERIMKKIHTYNAKRAKFTTWVYAVCGSVLNKDYQRNQRYAARFIQMPQGLDENRIARDDSTSSASFNDFYDTIEQLKTKYPDKVGMINAIFVNKEGALNDKIVYRRAAMQCGVSAAKVSEFFRTVVRPFFIERFEGEAYNE